MGHAGGSNCPPGLARFAGHLFPVWLKFKGGKGVATGLGVIFGWSWMLGLVFCAVWAGGVLRNANFISWCFVCCCGSPGLLPCLLGWPMVDSWPYALLAGIVSFTHRANIARLMKGEEPQIQLLQESMSASRQLSDAERLDWLRLTRTESIGPSTFFKLIQRYKTAAKAIEALPHLLSKAGFKARHFGFSRWTRRKRNWQPR